MEEELTMIGSSLPVPCVQELGKEPFTTVPHRYVRPDQDPPFVSETATSLLQVPVIDMNKLLSDETMPAELQKLHLACRQWGFFQLINHGVGETLLESVKSGIKEFFSLPMEEKKQFWQQPEDMEGFGQAFVVSENQKLDWSDMFYLISLPKHFRKPHLFPKLPQQLRDDLEVYSAELEDLAKKILDLMAKALGVEANYMEELFDQGTQMFRMNYYPPCKQPELVIGLNPHSDPVGLTILLQVNEMEGLQVRKDGRWTPIKPLNNAFIVNVGDILEIVTNGIYRSIEHRATVNQEKERLSIATFYSPNLGGDLGPAPSLITPERPALFKRIGVADYFRALFARKLEGKSYIDVMRIQHGDEDGNGTQD
uniref:protein SRG1-like n=1 Tax=Fragaria vesca subsp. vesca TaxID=101020 RepID=UPI0005C87B42|nr:PREDICTED: protein SRG1-like [Fragaria vesca subsp. vesca]